MSTASAAQSILTPEDSADIQEFIVLELFDGLLCGRQSDIRLEIRAKSR